MQEEHGITPTLEQADPGSDPGPENQETYPGSLRPVSRLQERDPQTHVGAPPERPPYEMAAPSDTMGAEHVELALSDLVFPLTKQELLDRAGNWRIPTTGTHFHQLRDYLDGVDARKFGSAADVARAIRKSHRELR